MVVCEELKNGKITPAEYMIKGFDFFKQFKENETVKQKEALLIKIKELSFGIYEDVPWIEM